MKALTLLLGARAIDVAEVSQRRRLPETDLPPIASTPEQHGAWARWAAAGRTEADRAARPQFRPGRAGRPAANAGPG